METVTNEVFFERKQKFFKKHGFDYVIHTSDMENGKYVKTYCFTDGANWYEEMEPVWEKIETYAHLIKIETEVKFAKTEFWSSEDRSAFFYERW